MSSTWDVSSWPKAARCSLTSDVWWMRSDSGANGWEPSRCWRVTRRRRNVRFREAVEFFGRTGDLYFLTSQEAELARALWAQGRTRGG